MTIPTGDNATTFQISVIANDLAETDEAFELELTVLEEPYFAVPCATESSATVVIVDGGMCGLHQVRACPYSNNMVSSVHDVILCTYMCSTLCNLAPLCIHLD